MLCGHEPLGGGCEALPCGFGMDKTPEREISGTNNPVVSVDKILAADLEKLSLQEREKVYEDVHGVSDVIKETPELIARCLQQMDREIDLIKKKDAYEQAKLQSTHLVTNREFLLAFLRYSSFNPKKAAFHLVRYYKIKLEMFGTEFLAKSRITLEDIGEAATRVLELGSMQVLPNRDSRGRVVVVSSASFMEPAMDAYDDPIPSMVKAVYYLMSTLYEDEESQKNGVVVVANGSGLSERHAKCHRTLATRLLAIGESFPIRLTCLHYYYTSPSSFSSMLLSVLASAANSIIRVRVRTHHGSHTECLYSLMPFGIPVQEFPFTADGGVQLSNHVKWMEQRRKKEAYLSNYPPIEGAVVLPSNYDVLWGRGKQVFRHPGNRLLYELVETYYDQYNRLSKEGKTSLADQLVAVVHGFSGRFMKLDKESGMWVEASSIEAREKVTHRFRHSRAVDLKGGSTRFSELNVTRSSKGPSGGGKRPRVMLNGS
eukprot:scaffold607_cov109-Cylindrotheca_fusiformis.AAC.1